MTTMSEKKLPTSTQDLPVAAPARTRLPGFIRLGAVVAFIVYSLNVFGWPANTFRSCSHIHAVYGDRSFSNSVLGPIGTPIDWQPCPQNKAYSCGYLAVPKDYRNASAGVSHIALLKVPATVEQSQRLGTIFINPGGPGGSGVGFAAGFGQVLTSWVDGRYDFIGFDPRGIGSTIPRVECFPSSLSYALFKAGTVLERGFDIPQDPSSFEGRQHMLDQYRQLKAMQQTEYEKCGKAMGDELRYMGTSTVVRDIEEMSRVLEGPDAPINFFGGSYGTILGAYLVNMIPDKIGKVIIDGVASSPQWANNHTYDWLKDWMINTEETFQWFLKDCSEAGPKHCPLAKVSGEKPEKIERRLMEFLDYLFDHPMAIPDAVRPGILNSGGARSLLYATTNQPGTWPIYSRLFALALDGNPTPLYDAFITPFPVDGSHIQTDLSRVAVSCLDSLPFEEGKGPSAELLVNKTLETLKTSPHFGASVTLIEPDGGCEFWPAAGKAPERFTGPWNATLKTPMLIISNTADPITPLASGREINTLMGDSSRLLIQNSPGHCSLGSVSRCTGLIRKRYLLNGELPENGHLCEVDRGYFPTGQTIDADLDKMSAEDKALTDTGIQGAALWADWQTGRTLNVGNA